MIQRIIYQQIISYLFQSKHIIIYGPRQVGKTTLAKKILADYGESADYYTADDIDIVRLLEGATSTELGKFVGSKKLIVIDEAQRVPNIGLTLKLLHDCYPHTQIIATGSSSFDLANTIAEPLTGRKYTFHLYPFSLAEIAETARPLDHTRLMDQYIQFGLYPDVFLSGGDQRTKLLTEITRDYLYKDILAFRGLRKPDILVKLVQSLALQAGSEVSYTELAQLLAIDTKTVEEYITILEQAFIVHRLPSFARNLRNELKKSRKIYFRDTGIRNAVINNLNPLSLRTDQGALRENFAINELIKYHTNRGDFSNRYFWRTHTQQDIDLIREEGGMLHCYEMKRGKKKTKIPLSFVDAYPNHTYTVVSLETIWDVVNKV